MTDDSNIVLQAADKMGFNLEFRAKGLLEENNYTTSFNVYLDWNNQQSEVDIRAYNENEYQRLLIECKGSKSGSYLILINEPTKTVGYPNCLNIADTDVTLPQVSYLEQETTPPLTFTGDFFHTKTTNNNKVKELVPSSKNETDSNFYKAQSQLTDSIFLQSELDKSKSSNFPKSIIPLIITNSKIWTVDYESRQACLKKWALHKASTSGHNLRLNVDQTKYSWFIIPVINIEHIDEFIGSYNEHTKYLNLKIFPKVSNGNI